MKHHPPYLDRQQKAPPSKRNKVSAIIILICVIIGAATILFGWNENAIAALHSPKRLDVVEPKLDQAITDIMLMTNHLIYIENQLKDLKDSQQRMERRPYPPPRQQP